MLLEYYGFAEAPFSITPDPRFVYLSERHRDALAHLHYGITQGGGGGFVQLTGEVGTGKTTLCRLLLEQLPENVRVALVLNPLLSPVELLEAIAEELRLDIAAVRGSLKGLYDRLNAYLIDAYAQGLRVVVIIDEAQNLSKDALEQVRLLTNLETPTQKLLQMVLLGQPELRDMLEKPELRQLAQRITARFHLTPLDADEVDAYVRHRVAVAGATRFPFTRLAVKRLHQHSGGVPRLVNVIAERALLAGYARDEHPVGERLVDLAAREVLVRPLKRLPKPPMPVVIGAVLLLGVGLFALTPKRAPTPPTPELVAEMATPIPPPRLDAATLAARLPQLDPSPAPAAAELMRMWAVRAHEATPRRLAACAPVLSPGLLCQTGPTSLDALVALQRPALVQLERGENPGVWAVLLGADALRVRLWLGDIVVDVARVDFNRYFRGRHLAIWRGPTALARIPAEGDIGSEVDWLASRVALQQYAALRPGPAEFDAALVAALRDVQRVHGLPIDGVPGSATLRALGAERSDGPRLRRALD
ncbi:MAG: AAA family ATPase [Silanimonas sp.]